eukprot:365072-Chlamydomonas_euryale.AAC.7
MAPRKSGRHIISSCARQKITTYPLHDLSRPCPGNHRHGNLTPSHLALLVKSIPHHSRNSRTMSIASWPATIAGATARTWTGRTQPPHPKLPNIPGRSKAPVKDKQSTAWHAKIRIQVVPPCGDVMSASR